MLGSKLSHVGSKTLLPQRYSRRRRAAEGQNNDVYEYGLPSPKLRVQFTMIMMGALGEYSNSGYVPVNTATIYGHIVDEMREEMGTYSLTGGRNSNPKDELFGFISTTSDLDMLLDAIELTLGLIEIYDADNSRWRDSPTKQSEEAIARFNARAAEGGWGYKYEQGQIIRVDSEHLHSEVIVPALSILSNKRFESANLEYRAAHKAFREGAYEQSLVESAKAFESTLKVIGRQRGWVFEDHDNAAKIIQAAVTANFIAPYQQAGFDSLRKLLESVPTARNKVAGHGAGESPRQVPEELAALLLHQVAAVIVFLVESDEAQP